jgi:hypothetical protein
MFSRYDRNQILLAISWSLRKKSSDISKSQSSDSIINSVLAFSLMNAERQAKLSRIYKYN